MEKWYYIKRFVCTLIFQVDEKGGVIGDVVKIVNNGSEDRVIQHFKAVEWKDKKTPANLYKAS